MILTASTNNKINQEIYIKLNLLDSFKAVVSNHQVTISPVQIDDILSFLTEINIKKMEITETNSNDFIKLHEKMSDLCLQMVQHRVIFIVDRLPQFSQVFKDLVQAICWYRSDRKENVKLENAEVTILADLAHKLEK